MGGSTPDRTVARMKRDLVRAVAAEPDPTERKLTETFLEEFGAPPENEHLALFRRFLGKGDGKRPPTASNEGKRSPSSVNLIAGLRSCQSSTADLPGDPEAVILTVASSLNPTRAKLHRVFEREFGRPPSPEQLDLFFKQAGVEADKRRAKAEKTRLSLARSGKISLEVMDAILAGDDPTTGRFVKAWQKEHGDKPPPMIVSAFEKRLAAKKGRMKAAKEGQAVASVRMDQMKLDVVQAVLLDREPTQRLLVRMYMEEFGTMPDGEVMDYFNRELEKRGKPEK
ncbi:MAG: hypothetical protein ACLFOY_18225 [Desulfatibacillaceae bacterium]